MSVLLDTGRTCREQPQQKPPLSINGDHAFLRDFICVPTKYENEASWTRPGTWKFSHAMEKTVFSQKLTELRRWCVRSKKCEIAIKIVTNQFDKCQFKAERFCFQLGFLVRVILIDK